MMDGIDVYRRRHKSSLAPTTIAYTHSHTNLVPYKRIKCIHGLIPEIVWNSNIAFFNRKIDNSRDRRTKGSTIVHILGVCMCAFVHVVYVCLFFVRLFFICAFVFVYISLPCSIRSQHDDRINWFFVFFLSPCAFTRYLSCFDSLFHPVCASGRPCVRTCVYLYSYFDFYCVKNLYVSMCVFWY